MVSEADDLGEAYFEDADPAVGEEFLALSGRIGRAFDELTALGRPADRDLVAAARTRWEDAVQDLEQAAALSSSERTDAALDAFHDHLDESGALLADLGAPEKGTEVVDAIASFHARRSS